MEVQMNEMRNLLLLVAAFGFGGFAACNTTVGECWYYGEGTENAAAGVGPGGGVIVPTGPAGVGGSGDTPPPEPKDAMDRPPPDCNEEEDEDAIELGERVCKPEDWGAMCKIVCAEYGVLCPAGYPHNVTKKLGLLSKCCNCKGDQRCEYRYEDGGKCVLRPETGVFLCEV
jgi:hypothetical protein